MKKIKLMSVAAIAAAGLAVAAPVFAAENVTNASDLKTSGSTWTDNTDTPAKIDFSGENEKVKENINKSSQTEQDNYNKTKSEGEKAAQAATNKRDEDGNTTKEQRENAYAADATAAGKLGNVVEGKAGARVVVKNHDTGALRIASFNNEGKLYLAQGESVISNDVTPELEKQASANTTTNQAKTSTSKVSKAAAAKTGAKTLPETSAVK